MMSSAARGIKFLNSAAVNAIFHNDRVPELNDYLSFLDEAGADAVVFGDPAVLMAARESAPNMKLQAGAF